MKLQKLHLSRNLLTFATRESNSLFNLINFDISQDVSNTLPDRLERCSFHGKAIRVLVVN